MPTRHHKPGSHVPSMPASLLVILVGLLGSGCPPTWQARPIVPPRSVAQALDDPVDPGPGVFRPESVPRFKAPTAIRPCCVFGMDLKAKVGAAPVPGYVIPNILGPDDPGPHGYDKGMSAGENNGLVYTCRGGFIDVAHIRDNADRTLYLAMEIVRRLPDGFTLELPEEAAIRRVIVKPVSPALLREKGRFYVAVALAQWANYQLSIWHEIATWYGWESVKGFSEKISAFSLEDLYSNVVGARLSGGIILNQEDLTTKSYDLAMDVWIREGLKILGAVSRSDGRRAMQSVDGIYWDSRQRVPDNKLVLRRNLNIKSPQQGWRVVEAIPKGPVHDELKAMCEDKPGPLPMVVTERIGEQKIEDLVTVQFQFAGWIPESFPLPAKKGDTLTQSDFPTIMKDIHERGEKELGVGFDQPGPLPADIPVAWRRAVASPGERHAVFVALTSP